MIFSMLKDPKDLISVSNTTSNFNRILEPSKTTFMFGEVNPCIYVHITFFIPSFQLSSKLIFIIFVHFQVFQLLFPKLEKEDILNCRLVCKQWNHSVDHFLQNRLATRNLEPFPYHHSTVISSTSQKTETRQQNAIIRNHPPHSLQCQPLLLNKHLHPLIFCNRTILTNFLTEMDTHPRNPFALRFISLMSHQVNRNHLLDYWHRITSRLLPKFGQEIFHLQICPTISQGEGPYSNETNFYYRNLQNALKQSPNLKSLMLYGPGARYLLPNFGQETNVAFGYLAMNPLPPLPKLETLSEAMWNPTTQGPVMDQIMKSYSKQLKTISLGLSMWKSNISQYSNLPRCSSLYIHLDDNLEKWNCLCRQLKAPNLGKLALSIQGNFGIGMYQIFEPLQQPKFQSLVYLRLNFMEKLLEKEPTHHHVLENVKSLEVLENRFVQYDQLLRYLPRLEYMLVCYELPEAIEDVSREDDQDDGVFEIRKCMFSGTMYKSNIWQKMEFLREFIFGRMGTSGDTEFEVVSKVQYTREIYNRLNNQAGD